MILNNDILQTEPVEYKLNEDVIKQLANVINIDKKESYIELQDYIDSLILYYDRRSVLIKTLFQNRYNAFAKYIREVKIYSNNGDLNKLVSIKVPNNKFYKYPIMSKVPNDKLYDFKWRETYVNTYELYNNPDSTIYKKAVVLITSGEITKPSKIDNLVLYDIYKCEDSNDLNKALNKLIFPKKDIDYILNYIDNIKTLFTSLKTLPLDSLDNKLSDKQKINIAFSQVSNLSTYFKYIINILLNIYSVKIDVIFGGVLDSNTELTNISEICNIPKSLYELNTYLTEGLDIEKIQTNSNDNILKDIDYMLSYMDSYINTLYSSTLKELESRDDNSEMLNNISLLKKDISVTISQIEDEYEDICSMIDNFKIQYTGISSNKCDLFDRPFDKLKSFSNMDIENIRANLLNNDIIKEVIKNVDTKGLILHGNIDSINYGAVIYYLTISGHEDLSHEVTVYYNTLNNSTASIYGVDNNTTTYLPTDILQSLKSFKNKCTLIKS